MPTVYEVMVNGTPLNRFEYQVVRLWEYADEIEAGRWPESAPLLPMPVVRPDERELILQERDGRRFSREEVEMMRETSFIDDWVQEKLEEGRFIEFRRGMERGIEIGLQSGQRLAGQMFLLRILYHRFGEIPLEVLTTLLGFSLEQLERLVDVAFTVPDKESFVEEVRRMAKTAVG